jgi:hypothetical protein
MMAGEKKLADKAAAASKFAAEAVVMIVQT